jgi:quercetin dioxygenase-like cupin family protein
MSAKKSNSAKRVRVADILAIDAPLSETAAKLALGAPQLAPSAGVKAALMTRIRASKETRVAEEAGWRFAPLAKNADWVPLPFPGVKMREVTIDRERDTALLYVEMIPGAIFPDHQHSATERGLVLSGDLRMGEQMLGAGDFYEAAAGTHHARIASPSGCTGLLWVGADAWDKWRGAMAAMATKGTS